MSEPKRKRRFWQLHLSTTILMTVACGVALHFIAPLLLIEQWNLDGTVANLKDSSENARTKYLVNVQDKKDFSDWDFVVTDSLGSILYKEAILSYSGTPYIFDNDTLYFACYDPVDSGCVMKALDLKSKSALWTTSLQALGPTSHNAYHNRVHIKLSGRNIVVYGEESFGKYIETVDAMTGKTIRSKVDRNGTSSFWFNVLFSLSCIATAILVGICFEWLIRRREGRKP
jgi:hypothetical protein